MNFLCPSCRTPLPKDVAIGLVSCTQCAVQVDLTRVDTAPGQARLWPEVDLKGETVSGHLLQQRLGSGGMGTVYEAESPLGAPVAMKVLAPMLAAEPALRERFRREARALSKVKHPRVVQLFEEGEDNGFCWYSMELVKGLDLKHRLDKGVLSAAEVDALAVALLEALVAVHEAGVVHRDLKPSNVLMGPEGPRLCDFGIAQVSGASTLTESAALLGSLRYMAPEQRWGKADDRSDLYALGVVLHEALAGGVPGEQPLPGSVPKYLARFIERLTAQNPKHRPASAIEATRLLTQLRKGALTKLAIGGGVGALVLVGVIVLLTTSGKSTEPEPMLAKEPVVVDAGLDAGAEPLELAAVDAGTEDAGTPEEPTGSLALLSVGANSALIDGRLSIPLPSGPLTLPVGVHRVVFECPRRSGKLAVTNSRELLVTVTELGLSKVTWNCTTMSTFPFDSPKKVVKPSPKPQPKVVPLEPAVKAPPPKGLGEKKKKGLK